MGTLLKHMSSVDSSIYETLNDTIKIQEICANKNECVFFCVLLTYNIKNPRNYRSAHLNTKIELKMILKEFSE